MGSNGQRHARAALRFSDINEREANRYANSSVKQSFPPS
jgi:hypothetical protein